MQDLQKLMEDGIITQNEVEHGRRKVVDSEKVLRMANQKFEIYKDFVFPSSLEKAKGRVSRATLELEQIRRSSLFQTGELGGYLHNYVDIYIIKWIFTQLCRFLHTYYVDFYAHKVILG